MTLNEIAVKHGLQWIETTSDRNGYPSHIRRAIIGFDTYDEAKKIADEYGLKIQHFKRRDGWQLWYRSGVTAYGPYDYELVWRDESNANIEIYRPWDDEEVLDTLRCFLEDCKSLDGMRCLIDNAERILDELNRCEDGQFVVTVGWEYEGTYDCRVMDYHYDVYKYAIGLCE